MIREIWSQVSTKDEEEMNKLLMLMSICLKYFLTCSWLAISFLEHTQKIYASLIKV